MRHDAEGSTDRLSIFSPHLLSRRTIRWPRSGTSGPSSRRRRRGAGRPPPPRPRERRSRSHSRPLRSGDPLAVGQPHVILQPGQQFSLVKEKNTEKITVTKHHGAIGLNYLQDK